MKYLNKSIFGLACVAGVTSTGWSQQQENRSSGLPNIVLIMADDMGKECLNCYGNIEYKTPNLDRLAAQGILFDRCFSQPLSTPSRVQLMTGKYNYRNYEDFGFLNPNQVTFGKLMKDAGYTTCIAGKWQLNGLNRNNPGNQDTDRPFHFGFDEYCLWQLHHTKPQGERYANPLITQNGKDLPRNPDAYGPDVFSDYICDFIRRNSGKPFFAYYPMALIHDPFVPTPDSPQWKNPDLRYKADTSYVADMVAYVDKIVLKIENALKANGVWENTILIFTGDNGTGQPVYSKTIYGNIKGGKGTTLNTGNHVPMIITWPAKIKGSKVYKDPVGFADMLPTLADAGGIDPDSYSTDGKSFFSLLSKNKKPGQKEVFIHYTPRWGDTNGKYGIKSSHSRWVMNGEYKLYRDGRFYNTMIDPNEDNPLSVLTKKEQKIRNKYNTILQRNENEFPFHLNDKEFHLESK